jgi:signal transduction histidine kinase
MNLVRARNWYLAGAVFLFVQVLVSTTVKNGHTLAAFGDVSQALLLAIGTVFFARQIFPARGRERLFWILMSFGALLWFVPQMWYVKYEVFDNITMPDPSPGDIFLFLHAIPFMGALALRPHAHLSERRLTLDALDFALLLLWWAYLYVFVAMPYQFATTVDVAQLSPRFNFLYLIENIFLIVVVLFLYLRARGEWKRIYGNLLAAFSVYSFSSFVINGLISSKTYYSGSLYDLPLAISMILFCGAGLAPAKSEQEEKSPAGPGIRASVWPARLGVLALATMPLLALFSLLISRAPADIRQFRIGATLAAMFLMTMLVFLKQYLLNLELRRLLTDAQESFGNLRRMQEHLINSEKLAALGQLVAGAAHEINNPLTAILGYSELLAGDAAVPEPTRSVGEKIAAQARRTKRLVSNMLSFAQQQPATRGVVQVNVLLNNVLQLREPDLSGKKIRVSTVLDAEIPDVVGDSNHLLQVFLHIVNNAVDALQEIGGGILTVTSSRQDGKVTIEFADTGPGIKEPSRIFDPFYTTKPVGKGTGLGLSVCYGIVQDHGGEISCRNNPSGGATFTIKLPAAPAASAVKAPTAEKAAAR